MTNKINGIDVSECVHLDEWKHCNICKELIKTIPDRHQCMTEQDLRCEYYSDCYFKQLKRLQEENKRLQMLSCANCGEKYLSPDGSELYEKNVQLQKENEELKNRLKTLDDEEFVYEVTEIEYNNFKKMNEYKQALEEIRSYCDEQNLKADYTACYITNKIDEILNDN